MSQPVCARSGLLVSITAACLSACAGSAPAAVEPSVEPGVTYYRPFFEDEPCGGDQPYGTESKPLPLEMTALELCLDEATLLAQGFVPAPHAFARDVAPQRLAIAVDTDANTVREAKLVIDATQSVAPPLSASDQAQDHFETLDAAGKVLAMYRPSAPFAAGGITGNAHVEGRVLLTPEVARIELVLLNGQRYVLPRPVLPSRISVMTAAGEHSRIGVLAVAGSEGARSLSAEVRHNDAATVAFTTLAASDARCYRVFEVNRNLGVDPFVRVHDGALSWAFPFAHPLPTASSYVEKPLVEWTRASAARSVSQQELTALGRTHAAWLKQQGCPCSGAIAAVGGVDLRDMDLHALRFPRDLSHAWLSGSDLHAAMLGDTSFIRADFRGAMLDDAHLVGKPGWEHVFHKPDLSYVNADLSQASLLRVYAPDANLREVDLRSSNATDAQLARVDLSGANLRAATLGQAVLVGARLIDTFLVDSDLSGANLSGVQAKGADFNGAKLSGACLVRADMSEAFGLTQAQLDQACGDIFTQLPTWLSVRECDATERAHCDLEAKRWLAP